MFIPVILSDARRTLSFAKGTKRESKNPEDFSFIHTASGSSLKLPCHRDYSFILSSLQQTVSGFSFLRNPASGPQQYCSNDGEAPLVATRG